MMKPLTPLQLYKYLEKSNCGRCQLPSCLAFSAAVVAGRKKPSDCPLLSEQDREKIAGSLRIRSKFDPDQAEFMDRLVQKINLLDLQQRAPVIGAQYRDGKLVINSLGKEFLIDQKGTLYSDCHIIPWVKAPLFAYVANSGHQAVTGTWISFRELDGGMEWQNLFTSRCEQVLKDLADEHPDLFTDIADLFKGVPTHGFQADIELILHPLPHFPILICYQAADEDLASDLTVFFDSCCGVNLHIKSIFTLCSGLVQMFAKIFRVHA